MQLHDYQTSASESLLQRTRSILRSGDSQKNIYLKAITGSGKTIMMADYIKKVFDFYQGRENVAIIWMSIGTGGLQEQSRQSLERNLPQYIRIYNDQNFRSVTSLGHNSLLVLNWEAVNTMTIEEDGAVVYNNLAMREGEQLSLPELFSNTRENGTKLIMIIDEAHIGAEKLKTKDVQRTTVIKNEIDPNLIINVTATPVFSREISPADIIQVDTEEVISEGRIKRGVRIDDSMDTDDDLSFLERVIKSAVQKQRHLRELYDQSGNGHINPLGLIQIPNAAAGAQMRVAVEDLLEAEGVSYDRGNLAENVDNNINMTAIKESTSPVAFVITKQAIATGWDAPRAQILVKLRDTKSATFDAQTLGRILRMPDGLKDNNPQNDTFRFFEEDELNYGYVYTDRNYTLSVSEYKNIYPVMQRLKDEHKEDVRNLVLPKAVITKERVQVAEDRIRQAVTRFVTDYWVESEKDFDNLNIIVSSGEYTTANLEEKGTALESVEHKMSDQDVQLFVKEFLNKVARPYIDENRLLVEFIRALQPHYGEDFLSIKKWLLSNATAIRKMAKDLNDEAKHLMHRQAQVRTEDFSFPESILMNAKFEEEVFDKCAYTKQVVRTQETEKYFERFLDRNPKITWWIKNSDSGKKGLSLEYSDPTDNRLRLFFPDYVVRFEDDSVGIYETKSLPDPYSNNTNAKRLVLSEYISQLNQTGGLRMYGGVVHLEKDTITGSYEIIRDTYREPEEIN